MPTESRTGRIRRTITSVGRPGGAHYSGSKAAVDPLTHIFAVELGEHGIRVNAIAPG